MVLNGHVYRGRKPVNWSPSSRTALAEAELEYPEGHKSKSIYVSMPLKAVPKGRGAELAEALQGAALAVWTTTPWTIPANLAVAVNERMQYSVVQVLRSPAVARCVWLPSCLRQENNRLNVCMARLNASLACSKYAGIQPLCVCFADIEVRCSMQHSGIAPKAHQLSCTAKTNCGRVCSYRRGCASGWGTAAS